LLLVSIFEFVFNQNYSESESYFVITFYGGNWIISWFCGYISAFYNSYECNQWCSRGHTQVYAVCLLFSSGCLHITTSKDQYLRIPSVYPLVLLFRKSVIYCSFPYNGVPYSCVKLVILCCNWCIITSVILPFPAHHRLRARVRCIERTPLKAAFVFHLRAGMAY